jgi:ABC-2 type transport system permease protein
VTAATPTPTPASTASAVRTMASLKWHLLVGGLRGSRQQRVQTVMAFVISTALGVLGLFVLWGLGRSADIADDLIVVLLPVVVFGIGLLSASTGVESSIDARHLASEPIGRWTLGLGMLAAAAVGPPAVLSVLTGTGIVMGWTQGSVSVVVVLAAVVAWWVTLLLFSRTFANLLGALATGRLQQVAQAAATLSALLAWVLVQVLARDTTGWDAQRWSTMADWARWTPPGQLGLAIATAGEPGAAVVHLVLGLSWLPLLVWSSVVTTERLALSSPRPGGRSSARGRERSRSPRGRLARVLPASPAGAIGTRTVRTKFRTPRQAVNTVTALAIGAGVFLLGPLLGNEVDPRMVIVGGLLHFAVLFDGNNAFGMDGPAIWCEVAAGADGGVLVRGKVMSSLTVMALPALLLPLGMAALTGGWQWLVAGWLVAVGSVLAASGVAVSSAVLAPVAMPDSPNPLAAGDTGQGCVAGLMLATCMFVLGLVSLPVAAGILVASSSSAVAATLVAAAAPVVGALVLWGGIALASTRLRGVEEQLVQKVTPAR